MMGLFIMQPLFKIFKMKKIFSIAGALFLSVQLIFAQVMPQGFLIGPTGMIGSQLWATKNLAVTTFKNGNTIPNYTSSVGWSALTTPAMCSYNFDTNNDAVYGKLYNWYAVNDSRGVCPTGWHVPSDAEFAQLNTYIGADGGALKEVGTTHWISPNTGATDKYAFTALPAGYMGTTTPSNLGNITLFWTTSSYDATHAYTWSLSKDNAAFTTSVANTKVGGFSVRCLHD